MGFGGQTEIQRNFGECIRSSGSSRVGWVIAWAGYSRWRATWFRHLAIQGGRLGAREITINSASRPVLFSCLASTLCVPISC